VSDVAALIADMVRAGVDADLVGRTAAALSEREAVVIQDDAAVRRRAADRARKAEARLRKSAEVCGDTDATPPSQEGPRTPKETQPTPPSTQQEKTPKGVQKKGSRLPADWVLPDGWGSDAIDAGLPANLIDLEAAKMRDWSLSSKAGVKLDWRATWRNWCRDAASRSPPRASPLQRQQTAQEILKSRRQVNSDDDRPPNRPVLIASR
jgi:hypothetical protein